MKTFLITFLALVLIVGTTYAQTKKDVEALVKKAITYYQTVGKDNALATFSDPNGEFSKNGLYICVDDLKGVCLAHGANAKMVGKDWSELKDADGKAFVKERQEIAKKPGKGWQTYKWTNPASKKIEVKSTYIEKVNDVIFTCGIYGTK